MRLFLAINLPAEVRQRAADAAAPMRDAVPGIAWVPPEKLHLTLRFLGEQPDAVAPELDRLVHDVAAAHSAFSIGLRGIGGFPTLRRARVVWMGVQPEPRLELLHHDIELACAAIGFELEGRPFRPHVTLGRVRAPLDAERVDRLRAAARTIRYRDEFLVQSIESMQSVTGPSGSAYARLASAPLRLR